MISVETMQSTAADLTVCCHIGVAYFFPRYEEKHNGGCKQSSLRRPGTGRHERPRFTAKPTYKDEPVRVPIASVQESR